jgi:hypothetical protein
MPWRNTQEYHSCHKLYLMNGIISCFIKCFCWLISFICDKIVTTQNLWFFQEKLLKVLKCYNFLWVQRRHNCSPAASFCTLRYYTIPVKSVSAKVSFYTNNSKMPNFDLWHSCHKWAIYCLPTFCSYRTVISIAVRPSQKLAIEYSLLACYLLSSRHI